MVCSQNVARAPLRYLVFYNSIIIYEDYFMATWNSWMANIVDRNNEQRTPFPIVPIGIEKI
jgi:hypothetical protein